MFLKTHAAMSSAGRGENAGLQCADVSPALQVLCSTKQLLQSRPHGTAGWLHLLDQAAV